MITLRKARRSTRHRSGSAYLVVLGAALIVSTLAYSGLMIVQSRSRTAREVADSAAARQIARDAIEVGRQWIYMDPNWRTNRSNGAWVTNMALAGGSFSLEVNDPLDGDIRSRPHDPVTIKATGVKGQARHVMQVTLEAKPVALPALNYSLHTGGELHVTSGKTLTATGSTVSTNGTVTNQGTINANVSCTLVGISLPLGTINGTTTLLAPAKAFPISAVPENYATIGTLITPSTIDGAVLAPGLSPYGTSNPYGIYVVRPPADFTIKNCRLYGTLVVICPAGKKVIIDGSVLLEPATPDQPSLIIKGNADILFVRQTFSESSLGRNFNPAQAPVDGVSDSSIDDQYASEIRGLVHVTGKVTLKQTAFIRGALLCESTAATDAVRIEDTPSIVYTPALATKPPMWYTTSVPMAIQRGSWKQVAN